MRVFNDPAQKELYDKARDRVLNDGKPVLTAAKEFQIPVTSLWHYVRQIDWNYRYRKLRTNYTRPSPVNYVPVAIAPRPPAQISSPQSESNVEPWSRKGSCNIAKTRSEKRKARAAAKLFADSGIIYDNALKSTVCTWCNCYVNWIKVSDIRRHCETRKHLQDRVVPAAADAQEEADWEDYVEGGCFTSLFTFYR